jgi:hypothetical protein
MYTKIALFDYPSRKIYPSRYHADIGSSRMIPNYCLFLQIISNTLSVLLGPFWRISHLANYFLHRQYHFNWNNVFIIQDGTIGNVNWPPDYWSGGIPSLQTYSQMSLWWVIHKYADMATVLSFIGLASPFPFPFVISVKRSANHAFRSIALRPVYVKQKSAKHNWLENIPLLQSIFLARNQIAFAYIFPLMLSFLKRLDNSFDPRCPNHRRRF